MNQILKDLGIKEINLGSCVGAENWIDNSEVEIQLMANYLLK